MRVGPPDPRHRQVRVPPLGDGGVVVSRTVPGQEASDFAHLRTQYRDSLIPWDTRPDLDTVDEVLGWLQRRALPDSEVLTLKRRIVADLVGRAQAYKCDLLERVLEESGFWQTIERRRKASGKTPDEFSVLIKPNTMMVWSPYEVDPANATDPGLVLHLVARLWERGYTSLTIGEAQNVYSHWYTAGDPHRGRTVPEVYGWVGVGYPIDGEGHSVDADGRRDGRFRVIDQTLEAEGHTHDFGQELRFIPRTSLRRWLRRVLPCAKRRTLGEHPLAPSLRDADFRISFACNKTHTSCFNTLTLKNVYGCFPAANKFLEYHCRRDFDWPTIVLLREFPFHFGIIDALFSADGVLGFKADYFPRMTRTLIAGEDLVAVDIVGSLKMGLDPRRSRMIWLAAQVFGFPIDRIRWLADDTEPYPKWINIPRGYDWIQYRGEKWYFASSYLGQATSEMDPHFQPRPSVERDRALAGQRLYTRFIRPGLNIVEGWGRTPRWGWLWARADRPERLKREYAEVYGAGQGPR